ncbi:hypothetical protein [Plantibacter sp. CFBP 8775]|uniref:hypothetical protein n=1 Tax=Plantibacter sp. CFBP 8775 TaxID=2774038 RepID=UPI0017811715|nr:hypothetical protein [Plantibacter sp. CFBP 8775]MBD8104769.1 hypothetical protein [Plantibacter sp. CFBP 8775]
MPEIMRCSELIPLEPELPLLVKREQKLLAAWESEVAQLQAEGWRVIRRSRTESPLMATYRLFYQFARTQTAAG